MKENSKIVLATLKIKDSEEQRTYNRNTLPDETKLTKNETNKALDDLELTEHLITTWEMKEQDEVGFKLK